MLLGSINKGSLGSAGIISHIILKVLMGQMGEEPKEGSGTVTVFILF